MSCYISSNNNRYYVGLETSFGTVSALSGNRRIPALQLNAKQQMEQIQRRDKIGGRTFSGHPSGLRRRTSYTLRTLLTGWTDQSAEPCYGPLFQSGLGGAAMISSAGTVQSAQDASSIGFASPHGLTVGQAVVCSDEIRFVSAVIDPNTVRVNAPFSLIPVSGSPIGPTATYIPSDTLSSVSLFDYWSPSTAVQRILFGAAVDTMRIKVNADYHEFEFRGPAKDLTDNVSFSAGIGALTSFPPEPVQAGWDYSIIPGHLGQAWLGGTPTQFFSVTAADITIDNNLDMRAREFGSEYPQCIVPGERNVSVNFSLYSSDNAATNDLYAAARQGSPVPMMFQLGQQASQLFGVYLKSVKFDIPEFKDTDRRLEWEFINCRAEGITNDEIFIAFG